MEIHSPKPSRSAHEAWLPVVAYRPPIVPLTIRDCIYETVYLVAEVADGGEDHGQAEAVGGGDYVGVFN